MVPSFSTKSSCHLPLGRLLDLFTLLACHCEQRFVHLLSFILAIYPAHFQFCFSVYSIMSIIFVLLVISKYGTLSAILDMISNHSVTQVLHAVMMQLSRANSSSNHPNYPVMIQLPQTNSSSHHPNYPVAKENKPNNCKHTATQQCQEIQPCTWIHLTVPSNIQSALWLTLQQHTTRLSPFPSKYCLTA